MLSRFTEIKNIGRFCDAHPGGRSFAEKTVIFGNNGNGKSTITAILRSLSENDPGLIKERKTFGETSAQIVKMVFTDGVTNTDVSFQGGNWNIGINDIRIFDSKFIAENVFDGERLVDEHRANLHRVVVGEQGKILAEKISILGDKIRAKDSERKRKEQEYALWVFSTKPTLDEFIALIEDKEIDEKIKKLESELEFANLSSKPDLPDIGDVNFGELRKSLDKNLGTAHSKAKDSIEEHIKKHWKDKGGRREFIGEGLSLMDHDCPFCGQGLDGVRNLIDSYVSFFDQEYKNWETTLRERVRMFKAWNLPVRIATLESNVSGWSKYMKDECGPLLALIKKNKDSVLASKASFDAQCDNKISNFGHKVDYTSLDSLAAAIAELATQVRELNTKIDAYKIRMGAKDVKEITKQLSDARMTRARFTPPWPAFCKEYEDIKSERNRLDKDREAVMQQLNTYSQGVFTSHQGRINWVLEYMGADFRIADFTERTDRRKQGAVFCGFDLKFFNIHTVPIETNLPDAPHFHNTLSQGDKNLLAFAFFMATLWNDSELTKRIIVVDDPISSFDNERKEATVALLSNITASNKQKPQQLIILTHEVGFLAKITEDQGLSGAKYLKVSPKGISSKGCKQSDFDDCDPIDEFLKQRELKMIEEIRHIVDSNGTVPTDADDKCRIVLESIFKSKYHLELKTLSRASSIGDYVQELQKLGIYDSVKVADFQTIIPRLHRSHHSSGNSSAANSAGDIYFVLRETLRLARSV